jgi:predicted alpha/beta-fold hydrolase
VAILIHGLSGSARSTAMIRMAAKLLKRNLRVVRINLRGAGQGVSLARGVYHAGRSADIRAVLDHYALRAPGSPVVLVGMSLGGNLALRTASELAEFPVPNLERVFALSPPIDLGQCAELLTTRPGNRIYETFFLKELVRDARKRQYYFPDLPPLNLPRHLTQRIFDDLYTAPRCGFADAMDYYRTTAPLPYLDRIPVPTLMLTSRDDPFIAVEPFEKLRLPAHITVRIQEHGGHLGFLGWDGAGGVRWAERRMIEWIVQPLELVNRGDGWAPPRKG